jgi:pyridoxamine 5'-phosphate oxidase
MIEFKNINQDTPYLVFIEKYNDALDKKQELIEAMNISSYNNDTHEVNSRYVNLKIIDNNQFIFFTNYNSHKSEEFDSHNQVASTFYWSSTNMQIRIKANIKKTSVEYNQKYFSDRSAKKNALAISSNQSKKIDSYKSVIKKYNKSFKFDDLSKCPNYWGGYSFIPYSFEFWEGHESRLNKRYLYQLDNDVWKHSILEP